MNEPIAVFAVEGELTIYRAAELHVELKRALMGTGSICLDLSAVTELDSAGVQLLLAARRGAIASGGTWRIAALSDAARDVFQTLGVSADLADSETTQAAPAQ